MSGNYTFQYKLVSPGVCPDDVSAVSVVINPLPVLAIANVGQIDCSHQPKVRMQADRLQAQDMTSSGQVLELWLMEMKTHYILLLIRLVFIS